MYRSHYIGADRIGRCSSGNSKVCHLYFTICGDNDILRFHISVNDTMAVCRLQTHRNLNCDTCGLFNGKLPLLGDVFLQSDTLDQFHNNVINTAVISYVKYIDDIRMCKTSCRLGLTSEFLYKRGVFPKLRFQDLHCNKTVQLMVHSLIDICHSASSDFSYDLIALGYDHSRLQHASTSFVNGSTSTTAILSLPPF